MRPIKFRVWDKDKKVMIYDGDLMISLSGKVDEYSDDDGGKSGLWEHAYSVNVELMQFTGLKDKNGKEIYEGDIANITYTCMRFSHWKEVTDRGIMEWTEKSAEFSFKVENSILNEEMSDLKIEVIGNIYEHPELLEAK